MTRSRPHDHLRAGSDGVIATFVYADKMRSLNARSREDAFARAREQWGDDWIGEPCFSTVVSIYRDVTGLTALEHGQNLASSYGMRVGDDERSRRWREGK